MSKKDTTTKRGELTSAPSLDFGKAIKRSALVGVLLSPKIRPRTVLLKGREEKLKREMVLAANQKNICMYFFYPDGVNSHQNCVDGFTFHITKNNQGKWVEGKFPLPDIVYNRLLKKNEKQPEVQKLLEWFEHHPHIHIFNSRFLNKWEVYDILSHHLATAELVPETRTMSKENLFVMLCKYREIFLKPISKSVGRGIIKIKRQQRGKPLLYKPARSNGSWIGCSSTSQLYKRILSIIDPEEKYLIQKGINLATLNGRVFDLRTEVQKNGQGQWIFTGVGVRIAAQGCFITHVPNGGTKAAYEEVIKKVFGKSRSTLEKLNEQLTYICNHVPETLENGLGISLGILSLDIGIDKEGTMHIIEVNSKPACFDENNIRKKHLDNLNAYFLYMVNSSGRLRRGD